MNRRGFVKAAVGSAAIGMTPANAGTQIKRGKIDSRFTARVHSVWMSDMPDNEVDMFSTYIELYETPEYALDAFLKHDLSRDGNYEVTEGSTRQNAEAYLLDVSSSLLIWDHLVQLENTLYRFNWGIEDPVTDDDLNKGDQVVKTITDRFQTPSTVEDLEVLLPTADEVASLNLTSEYRGQPYER